ncbi:hypothetical protein CBR_g66809 [Chara braunii]|uniref:Uncharacterized protein n=1 Tax=Chara braunii TaxID=69332 RepID=A0A388K9C0_CHABU|nr:hypothetical protein CBR_g66809 [Chara braunii]|eukprot:GBG66674.1 hypothetical protein CBR_g66809 [Chara braunii]
MFGAREEEEEEGEEEEEEAEEAESQASHSWLGRQRRRSLVLRDVITSSLMAVGAIVGQQRRRRSSVCLDRPPAGYGDPMNGQRSWVFVHRPSSVSSAMASRFSLLLLFFLFFSLSFVITFYFHNPPVVLDFLSLPAIDRHLSSSIPSRGSRMAVVTHTPSPPSPVSTSAALPAACGGYHSGPAVSAPNFNFTDREKLYNEMGSNLERRGPLFLTTGETTQSLKISDLFVIIQSNGSVRPIPKPLMHPVRATLLYIEPAVGITIWRVVKQVIAEYFPQGGVWYQDPQMFHVSLYHASNHIDTVPATTSEIDEETNAVARVARTSCPVVIALDRVIVTSTGAVIGCWQLLDGTEPAQLRKRLRSGLPRSPQKQMNNQVLIHTSFARLLVAPTSPNPVLQGQAEAQESHPTKLLLRMARELSKRLCRLRANLSELWYVEELDMLALALRGNMRQRKFPLSCEIALEEG